MTKKKLKKRIAQLEWKLSFEQARHLNQLREANKTRLTWMDKYFDLLDKEEFNNER